ncbi:DUF3427 domain-containing protein [Erysipelothrix rhusiopathiae]|nr:DUF3427 domain-containing protein [Erysipelothrix rhusiopathiae]
MELAVLLKGSLETSYLDNTLLSNEKLLTNLLINDYRRGEKVLTSIQKELLSCNEFKITVAFVTEGGLSILANQMLHCIEHNIKGKIITSSYLFFNNPRVFRKLLSYPNLEVRVHEHKPLHSKGYIFHHEGYSNLIVGSSNLTQGALTTNNEWNIKLSSLEDGKIYRDSIDEFDYLWNNSTHLSNTWIDAYEKKYYVHQQIKEQIEDLNQLSETIKPNQMQSEALENLRQLRISGASRALVISATGTGKTFLAAFDVKAMKPKRMLFIIHREQVARDAMDTFKSIIDNRTMGLYTGNYKDDQFDYLFTTIQTISKPQTLKNFKVDDFDYIVIDEAHRSAANTYINVMEYFKPKFILGMTATPERGDSLNIFELFDYNIAYEIRLQKALEENMLVPFHYFGITDLKIDGEIINDHSQFGQLVSDDRIEHILKYTKYYGHCGNKLKGLMFCSTNDEASELSKKLNTRGLRTISLSGKNSQQERENAIIRLTSDDGDLDYILTVDIFNEGIDIPEINQIVMLRSTESAIVFIQQLGRGLRLSKNKDYVVVIDFIGNYSNNYMIPIALSGNQSYSKDEIKKYLIGGKSTIPGSSTVEFDKTALNQIYKTIDSTNFSATKHLRLEYNNLKYRLGRVPALQEFITEKSIDPQLFIKSPLYGNYYTFLKKIDKTYEGILSDYEIGILTMLSKEISSGKRDTELRVLEKILNKGTINDKMVRDVCRSELEYDSTINMLQLGFVKSDLFMKYGAKPIIIEKNNNWSLNAELRSSENLGTLFFHLRGIIDLGLVNYREKYIERNIESGMVLYERYTRKDMCWLFNWKKDSSAAVYGYMVKNNTIPIFVTYHKDNKIDESIRYDDKFIDQNTFSWMSRNNVRITGPEIEAIKNFKKNNTLISLFVKKEDSEQGQFFYLGEMEPIKISETTITAKNKVLPIVNVIFKMKKSVRQDIYSYITDF